MNLFILDMHLLVSITSKKQYTLISCSFGGRCNRISNSIVSQRHLLNNQILYNSLHILCHPQKILVPKKSIASTSQPL
jgi:hypothetical protein